MTNKVVFISVHPVFACISIRRVLPCVVFGVALHCGFAVLGLLRSNADPGRVPANRSVVLIADSFDCQRTAGTTATKNNVPVEKVEVDVVPCSPVPVSLRRPPVRPDSRQAGILTLRALNYFLQLWKTTFFAQFEIIINVLVSSFWFIWIPMLCAYGHYKNFYSYSAGIDFRRQNLTSTDVRFWWLKSIPAL